VTKRDNYKSSLWLGVRLEHFRALGFVKFQHFWPIYQLGSKFNTLIIISKRIEANLKTVKGVFGHRDIFVACSSPIVLYSRVRYSCHPRVTWKWNLLNTLFWSCFPLQNWKKKLLHVITYNQVLNWQLKARFDAVKDTFCIPRSNWKSRIYC